ncbi:MULTISPECIES: hypothetical protein [Bacillaceae]|uniref:hypothetical protein n=1 Tax=Bacillaceae TaxID=186817 RepID=UPI002FFEA09A
MKSITVILFILSAVLLFGTGKLLLDLTRPGVYPPKQVIKKRALKLAGSGGICLLIAFMLVYFS